ncbi:MAG: aldolase [Oscillospiraceae bacterium]|nr:aldolase [Oscillospiraceae bacterium]
MEHIKLMYITNQPEVALIAENAGVDRIFVDMEYIGKGLRQGGMDTVQSHHTQQDVALMAKTLTKSQLLVRCNPIHEETREYCSSKEEIDGIIENGAQVVMLPYFKTAAEVEKFVRLVDGRAKTLPLMETAEAAEHVDEILQVDGIDEIYIGLNDMSLSYGYKFMFQLLENGTVDRLADQFRNKGLPFGFGGIASLDGGLLPGSYVLKEHYRLGSSSVILSRSFCNTAKAESMEQVRQIFDTGVADIRRLEHICQTTQIDYAENHRTVCQKVRQIAQMLKG